MPEDRLEALRAAWAAVARYRVLRKEPGKPDQVLATDRRLDEARAIAAAENDAIARAPGFRLVMSRPIAGIELENAEEARAACRGGS
jgi:hypothetical protein